MKILIVKLTSMGDILHTLPAIEDIYQAIPNIEIDWLVEESFQEIPNWHPAVRKVIPIATRRWRKKGNKRIRELIKLIQTLRNTNYDLIIDAQGLIKSAIPSCITKGKVAGFDKYSIKEPYATWFYNQVYRVSKSEHAINRIRLLCGQALDYQVDINRQSYGIKQHFLNNQKRSFDSKTIIFFHATTRANKTLPLQRWCEIALLAEQCGYTINLPWGNDAEYKIAHQIADTSRAATVLEKTSLTELANLTATATGAIAVDTGLGHMAAALGTPCLSLYASTETNLIGTRGEHQAHLNLLDPGYQLKKSELEKLNQHNYQISLEATVSGDNIWEKFISLIEQ